MKSQHQPYPVRYKIHPGLGIARLGDSPDAFYLAPEALGALPIECDQDTGQPVMQGGKPQPVSSFKKNAQVKREGVRFSIYVYDHQTPDGPGVQQRQR